MDLAEGLTNLRRSIENIQTETEKKRGRGYNSMSKFCGTISNGLI